MTSKKDDTTLQDMTQHNKQGRWNKPCSVIAFLVSRQDGPISCLLQIAYNCKGSIQLFHKAAFLRNYCPSGLSMSLTTSMRNLYLREFQQPANNTFYNLKDILLFYYEWPLCIVQ